MFHGIKHNLLLTGARAVAAVATAIIGLVATAPDADAAAFPLNKPVLITDVRAAIGRAGVVGTLAESLEAIAEECSPLIVVVRVAPGVASGAGAEAITAGQATTANVIGGYAAGSYTGLQALLAAEGQLGVRPRILGVPGLDTKDVALALEIVAKQLRGFAYTGCSTAADVAAAILYRGGFAAREHMLIYPDLSGGFAGRAVAKALGARARIDEQVGWHKTLSNVPLNGVSGLTRDVFFDLQDSSNDAGVLNGGDVTTLIRMNGYRFWGNRTCSDEPLYAFESAVRTSQALQDEIADVCGIFVDKPVTAGLIRDMLESINARFRTHANPGANQRIIGGQAWFDPAANANVDLSAGRVGFDYDFTPCAPAEAITLNQRITDRYYGALAGQL